jgi:hypothetical protein
MWVTSWRKIHLETLRTTIFSERSSFCGTGLSLMRHKRQSCYLAVGGRSPSARRYGSSLSRLSNCPGPNRAICRDAVPVFTSRCSPYEIHLPGKRRRKRNKPEEFCWMCFGFKMSEVKTSLTNFYSCKLTEDVVYFTYSVVKCKVSKSFYIVLKNHLHIHIYIYVHTYMYTYTYIKSTGNYVP